MSIVKHKKALVFFSAGVGDAILLVPLVNELKKQGYSVTGLFTSVYHCESIFKNTNLLDSIKVRKNKLGLFIFSVLNFRKYDSVYVNHFAFSNTHLTLSAFLGKEVYINYKGMTSLQSSKAIHFIEPKPNTHDALQHVFLTSPTATLSDLDFNIHYTSTHANDFGLSKNYVVIQVSSANNNAPYKNWAFENWLQLFKHLQTNFPNTQLVVLGDKTEVQLNEKLTDGNDQNLVSLIGKTTLNDVMEILHHSQFYIGLDSGLMHMAVALNKPTFTIWGASNPTLYGYEWIGPKHKIISLNLPCAPCSAWINPNTSRVDDSLKCPDFKCIRDISVSHVAEQLNIFIRSV
ncbi:MAG: glycosyltransferase family 9 protein [Bacteroidota bacterium]